MSRFMEPNSSNRTLRQYQIAKERSYSSPTPERYRQEENMPSPYRILSTSHEGRQKIPNTSFDDNSHQGHDLKRAQKTSNNPTT